MALSPPVAARVPYTAERSGLPYSDDWFWLRHRDDPATTSYLEAENAYADAWFAPLADLQQQIFDEIKTRTQETDLSVPVFYGGWWYFTRTVEGLAYPIRCRRRTSEEQEGRADQTLLDENVLAEGHAFSEVGVFDVSPSHRLLAWSVDHDGGEVYEMHIRDLETGTDLPDRIARSYYGSAWSADDAYLFYTVTDEAMRPYEVRRHRVGEVNDANDVVVYSEPDRKFNLSLANTRSGKFIVIASDSRITSEVRTIRAADPTEEPALVEARHEGVEYQIDHQGDRFLIVTNWDAPDFRVMEAPIAAPGRENWRDVIAHRPGARVHDLDAFADHLVVFEWSDMLPRLRIVTNDGTQRVLTFDEEVHSVSPQSNPEYTSTTLRFEYQSLVTPPTIIDEDVATGIRTIRKRQPVLGDFDSDNYVAVREWATASDGTRVPISVVARKGLARDGSNPTLLYGYGSYEACLGPWFSIPRLSLLDRGVVWAVAHVRGGGEGGRDWYLNGKLLHKRNTFTDFVAAAEHLVNAGYTTPARLAIRGASAGGLLVGACMTMRPDLYRAVVAEVPFVDVVNTMLDETLPLTIEEWDEWGNPNYAEFRDYMASYSPYDNVRDAAYPAVYITAGLNDPRVSYHEPAKFTAKLRALSSGHSPIVFKCEMVAGHGGPTGRYEAWKEEARTVSFLLHTLGVA
jgi:oligopeptidase B